MRVSLRTSRTRAACIAASSTRDIARRMILAADTADRRAVIGIQVALLPDRSKGTRPAVRIEGDEAIVAHANRTATQLHAIRGTLRAHYMATQATMMLASGKRSKNARRHAYVSLMHSSRATRFTQLGDNE